MRLDSFHLRPLSLVLVVLFLLALGVAGWSQLDQWTGSQIRLVLIALSTLALCVGLWAIRLANRRLAQVARVARAIEDGDYATGPELSGGDAVAELSSTLNRIARQTRHALGNLETREDQLHQLTSHDPLTGLDNRSLFFELLNKELAHARRAGQLVGVALFDLDRFKEFNESLGTAQGDQVLQKVAHRLRRVTREADSLARIGSDEFGLIVPRVPRAADVVEAVERVYRSFEEPIRVEDKQLLVPASVGISVFPLDGSEPEILVRRADAATSWAKARGGKTCVRFEAAMERPSQDQLEIEQEFPRALRDGQFLVYYQPQVAVADGAIVGLEALVRWQHPRRGLLAAGSFIPALERTASMPRLGGWLLDEICRQSAEWRRAIASQVPISVNVSARQFDAGNLVESVAAALDAHRLDPEQLQLEITESIAMRDIEAVSRLLHQLRDLGIRIHLDDFGTGFSSLGYLMLFPVDVLKVDRSFVSGLPDQPHSVAIVRSTIALARSLELKVIAEGVETAEQLDFLRREGCEVAQGYHLGRPLPATAMAESLGVGRVATAGAAV